MHAFQTELFIGSSSHKKGGSDVDSTQKYGNCQEEKND